MRRLLFVAALLAVPAHADTANPEYDMGVLPVCTFPEMTSWWQAPSLWVPTPKKGNPFPPVPTIPVDDHTPPSPPGGGTDTPPPAPVPVPWSFALLGSACCGVLGYGLGRRHA